jgi:hypothetical protein
MSGPLEAKRLLTRQAIVRSLALAVVFEVITLVMRFGLGLDATRDTASSVGRLTLGIRIHHGYIGGLLMGVGALLKGRHLTAARWLCIVGGALLLSDLIHHFAVLWPIMGDPMFHLVYPTR